MKVNDDCRRVARGFKYRMLAETKLWDAEKIGVTRMYNTLTDQEEPRDPDYSIFEYYASGI